MNKEFKFTCPSDLHVYTARCEYAENDYDLTYWRVTWSDDFGETREQAFVEEDFLYRLGVWKAIYVSGWDGFFDKEKQEEKEVRALDKQVSGDHYKSFKIQPAEYNHANNIGFLEGNVIKYVSRYKNKNGKKDLEKAIHCLEILIQLEYPDE